MSQAKGKNRGLCCIDGHRGSAFTYTKFFLWFFLVLLEKLVVAANTGKTRGSRSLKNFYYTAANDKQKHYFYLYNYYRH